ncbi:MAG: sigma-70 family RNA polymerase sigma factor [Bacteroidia bacterium]|nr:sigma-70 family RNA polymerase sigma factor [Bacteroidia bacterium]
MQDEVFIKQLIAGGGKAEKAIQTFFKLHKGMIGKAIKQHQLSEEECLDAYTDAIISLRRQVIEGVFRGESKISTYFYTIFYRRCVDLIRKKSTQKERLTEEYPDLADDKPIASDRMQIQEAFEGLMQYMEQLSQQCKDILMYRYYWGYEDMAEIASKLGIKNANTAGSLRYRCMQRLMNLLAKGN